MKQRTCALILLLAVLGCTAEPPTEVVIVPSPTAVPETEVEVAEASVALDTQTAIILMNADGSNARPLTGYTGSFVYNWSPDGRLLTFTAAPEDAPHLFTLDVANSETRQLTHEQAASTSPTWSPDGSRIAFTSHPLADYNDQGLYTILADGSDLTRLTTHLSEIYWLSWSLDGQQIAFSAFEEANDQFLWDIYVVNADGSHLRNLTQHPTEDSEPVWSPDGTKIAFNSYRDGNWGLYVMDVDGRNSTPLTQMPGLLGSIGWSPDGTQLLFKSNLVEGHHQDAFDLFAVNADGSNLRNLTNHPASDDWPQWSPDGTKIAFTSDRDGNEEIYVMNMDGTNPTRLTFDDGRDWPALWSPDGTQLAFNHSQPMDPALLPEDEIEITATPSPLPTPTAVPTENPEWLPYESDSFSLQYPASWTVSGQDSFGYFLSNESFGEGPQPIKYYVYAAEYLNPEGRPFPEVVTAGLSPELQQTFTYAQEAIGSYTVYRTTMIPSAEGALTLFFEGDGRYLALALTPYNAQNPFTGQEQYEQLFAQLLQTVQLTKE